MSKYIVSVNFSDTIWKTWQNYNYLYESDGKFFNSEKRHYLWYL